MKKIRELGSLPADAFEKYQRTAVSAVRVNSPYIFFQIYCAVFIARRFLLYFSLKKSESSSYEI